jgi:hypothetical protein
VAEVGSVIGCAGPHDSGLPLSAAELGDNRELAGAQWIIQPIEDHWDYARYFEPVTATLKHEAIGQANAYQQAAAIERHEFFAAGRASRSALRIWASQEAVVTGPFSQLLLLVAARIGNVHLRAGLVEVIRGEHNNIRGGTARHSHPWLLHQLCLSLGLNPLDVVPIPATLQFLRQLYGSTTSLLRALGAFGVGNERMLIPEYSAIRDCFEVCYPEAAYQGFLDANITEDTEHSAIMENVANALIALGANSEDYVQGAIQGVDARIAYYDELLGFVSHQPGREDYSTGKSRGNR